MVLKISWDFGRTILLVLLAVILWIHVEWIYQLRDYKIYIFAIILSYLLFVYLFVEYEMTTGLEDGKYGKLSEENLAELEKHPVVNFNNRVFHLLALVAQHPVVAMY